MIKAIIRPRWSLLLWPGSLMSEKSSLSPPQYVCVRPFSLEIDMWVCTVRTGNLFRHTRGGKSNLTHIRQPFLFVCMYTARWWWTINRGYYKFQRFIGRAANCEWLRHKLHTSALIKLTLRCVLCARARFFHYRCMHIIIKERGSRRKHKSNPSNRTEQ